MDEKLNQILDRVAELYMKYGVKSVTMDDLCRHLGISKKTLYEYVSEKDELIEKSMMRIYEKGSELVNEISQRGLNAIEELFEMSKYITKAVEDRNPACIYDMNKYYPAIHAKLQEAFRDISYQNVILNLAKGKKEGLYREDLNEVIIAKLHVSRIEYLAHNDFFIKEFASVDVFNEVFIYHLRGIASKKGLDYLEERIKQIKNN